MTKYYTRTGDDGTTGLLGDERVSKYDLRMEALGALDELSASLGLCRSLLNSEKHNEEIIALQRKLYELMTEVAASKENAVKFSRISQESVLDLEKMIDEYALTVDLPDGFIIPGDTPASAGVSLARAITRRAERRVAELLSRGDINNPEILRFLNRLSSLLFIMEINLIQEYKGQLPTFAKDKKK